MVDDIPKIRVIIQEMEGKVPGMRSLGNHPGADELIVQVPSHELSFGNGGLIVPKIHEEAVPYLVEGSRLQGLPIADPGHDLHAPILPQGQVRPYPVQLVVLDKEGAAVQPRMGFPLSGIDHVPVHIGPDHKKGLLGPANMETLALPYSKIMGSLALAHHLAVPWRKMGFFRLEGQALDRKSTRLNSSH